MTNVMVSAEIEFRTPHQRNFHYDFLPILHRQDCSIFQPSTTEAGLTFEIIFFYGNVIYRGPGKGLYVVGRKYFLLLLNYSALPFLGAV